MGKLRAVLQKFVQMYYFGLLRYLIYLGILRFGW